MVETLREEQAEEGREEERREAAEQLLANESSASRPASAARAGRAAEVATGRRPDGPRFRESASAACAARGTRE